MKGGSFMANTEIFLRNIFGTTRPNIRPLVLALNITNDLLFERKRKIAEYLSPCGKIGVKRQGAERS